MLLVHVATGVLAILAGFTALFAPKGMALHRCAGKLFAISMGATGVSAAWLGYLTDDMNDVIGGVMTVYLVATGWMAAVRKDGECGTFEWAAAVFALLGTAGSFLVAFETERNGASGLGAGPAFIFAAVIGYAALLDISLILRRGLAGRHRIARHLWRMCLAMFVATGSFFLGQMDVFPAALRKIEILAAPIVLVIGSMVFWQFRVLLTGWWRKDDDSENFPRKI